VSVKYARKEVEISLFFEDQFARASRGAGRGILDLEESRHGAIRAADLHNLQVGVVQHTFRQRLAFRSDDEINLAGLLPDGRPFVQNHLNHDRPKGRY
jgi:hypothetical protein